MRDISAVTVITLEGTTYYETDDKPISSWKTKVRDTSTTSKADFYVGYNNQGEEVISIAAANPFVIVERFND